MRKSKMNQDYQRGNVMNIKGEMKREKITLERVHCTLKSKQ